MSSSCLCCRFEQLFKQLLDQLQPVCTSEKRFLTSFFHFQKQEEPTTLEQDPDVSRSVCMCVCGGGGGEGGGYRGIILVAFVHSRVSELENCIILLYMTPIHIFPCITLHTLTPSHPHRKTRITSLRRLTVLCVQSSPVQCWTLGTPQVEGCRESSDSCLECFYRK